MKIKMRMKLRIKMKIKMKMTERPQWGRPSRGK